MDSDGAMKLLRCAVMEFLVTGIFTLVSAATVVTTGILTEHSPYVSLGWLDSPRLLVVALGHGLTIGIAVAASAGVSGGHVNPAVTLAFLVTGRMDLISGAVYIASQIGGAVIGGGLLKAAYGHQFGLGHHQLSNGIGPAKGFMLEVIATFILVLVIWGCAVNPKGPNAIAAHMIGITVLVNHLWLVPLTGASMNPARSFGTAVWDGYWKYEWVYWVGPPVGAVLAALVYEFILMDPQEEESKDE